MAAARDRIAGGRARGTAVKFAVPDASPWSGEYEGTVDGDELRGEILRGGAVAGRFTARRL